MNGPQMLHPRAFRVSVVWTLGLLLLGSVVHATESSLACPDWPTCFGTMVPEMTGGVFWEHLHRLVAGGLVLMFCLATWLARKEATAHPAVFRLSVAGVVLLLIQSVFGGITVIYQLPDLISTTHLALAFAFLALATYLASVTTTTVRGSSDGSSRIRTLAWGAAGLVFAQSVLGALVRHTDAGMACPDVPLCLGQVVPPLVNTPIVAHFTHRVLALIVTVVVISAAIVVRRHVRSRSVTRWFDVAAGLVVVQVVLGILSVTTILAVVPVSLHTLVAACLLSVLVHVGAIGDAEGVATPGSQRAVTVEA